MATSLLGLILALLLPISAAAGPLSLRLEQWPRWQLPAPLPRPSPGDDLIYPAWFEGDWQLSSSDGINAEVHFQRRADGAVVGTRAANAMAIGRAVLGDELLEVQDDPGNPNRHIQVGGQIGQNQKLFDDDKDDNPDIGKPPTCPLAHG